MSCGIILREATAADYDDVMDFSVSIYEGLDCLPVRYHEFCKDPERHMFAAEDDGKVVAFLMRSITDGGHSNVIQAARVHHEYVGRGLFMALFNYSHREIMKRNPDMQHAAYASIDRAGVESALKKFPYQKLLGARSRFTLYAEQQQLVAIVKSTEFHKLAAGGSYRLCKRQSEDKALASLVHEVPFDQFVPEGLWVVDYVPLGPHVNNYQKVAKNSSMYISRARKDSSIHAISFLTPSSAAAGWRFTADFYCRDTENDPLVLVAHVLRHLEEMATAKDVQHIWLTITYPESYPGTSSKHQVLTDLKDMNHRSGSNMWDGSLFVVSVDNAEMEKHMIGKARL